MRAPQLLLQWSFVTLLVSAAHGALAEDTRPFSPAVGDEAVVYIHKFTAQDYHDGKQLVIDGFSEAMATTPHVRLTYFLTNSATHEMMAVSFFEAGEDINVWHDDARRFEVLKALGPLRRAPLEVHRLRVDGVDVNP